MRDMEYRSWITIPGLPFVHEAEHTRLHDALVEQANNLGPVMTWTDDRQSTVVVLGSEAEDEAAAVGIMTSAVISALRASGLGHLYPASVEVQVADDDLVPA